MFMSMIWPANGHQILFHSFTKVDKTFIHKIGVYHNRNDKRKTASKKFKKQTFADVFENRRS